MKKKLRFAIIGCGRIANQHCKALKELEEAELVSVCDLKKECAEKFSKEYNVKYYINYNKMLKNENIDVVNIMTPSGMHALHSLEIMKKYKKHIVVEKPMALRLEDAEEMIITAEKLNLQLHVVMQNRYNKAVQKIKEAIQNNYLGKLILGTVRLRWCRPQRYYDQDLWRGKWAFDGGVLTNQAIHHIDLLRWFMDDIIELSAVGNTQLVDIEVENSAIIWLKFSSGAIGTIEATTAARPDDLEASISLLGENGTVIVEGTSVNKITEWSFGDIDKKNNSEKPPNVYGFGHLPFLNNVIESVKGRKHPDIDGKEGIKTLKLLHNIYYSMENNQVLRICKNNYFKSKKLGYISEKDKKIKLLYLTKEVEND